jgi:phosphatidylglycerol:prolipoprotein diacylglycerol transferase
VFDICVAVAVVSGVLIAERRAIKVGLDRRVILDMALWAVIPGFISSHLVSLVFYFPERLSDPWQVLNLFAGMSSFGGFVGGAAGVVFFFRYVQKTSLAPYSDPIVTGFTVAWVFGRLGCTFAFDHPGSLTEFALAMPYPGREGIPGGLRHNLGFYELLWAVALALLFWSQRKRPHFGGWHLAVFTVSYAPIRFLWDFLREQDLRYAGLTAGQYLALLILGGGVVTWRVWGRRAEIVVADGRVHVHPDGRPAIAEAAPPAGGAP